MIILTAGTVNVVLHPHYWEANLGGCQSAPHKQHISDLVIFSKQLLKLTALGACWKHKKPPVFGALKIDLMDKDTEINLMYF